MKKLLLCAFLALPILASSSSAAPTRKIRRAKAAKPKAKVNWRPSLAIALAEAKRSGKPIFVDFYTTWCGPCKALDIYTYTDRKFIAQSKNWIMVKVDAEKNTANVKLAQKYRIENFPSMLILRPDGREFGRLLGYYPAKMLVSKLKKAGVSASGGTRI